jgi:hypothetical protein
LQDIALHAHKSTILASVTESSNAHREISGIATSNMSSLPGTVQKFHPFPRFKYFKFFNLNQKSGNELLSAGCKQHRACEAAKEQNYVSSASGGIFFRPI